MATKNIAISEEAYQRLRALKKPGESFTDVIDRITKSKGILDLVGVLSESDAAEITKQISDSREESSNRVSMMREQLT